MRTAVKYIAVLFFTVAGGKTIAQDNFHINAFYTDANGRPLKIQTEKKSEGSPYFYDDYVDADVYMVNGKKYENIPVKVNLLENQVLFKNAAGQDMEATSEIKRIEFYSHLKDGVAFEPAILVSHKGSINTKGNQIFEVLVDSSTKLARHLTITYTDKTPYNEAAVIRKFSRNEALFILGASADSEPAKIQKNKESIVQTFADKRKQVYDYLENKRLKCRNEKEIAQVVAYYNTLK